MPTLLTQTVDVHSTHNKGDTNGPGGYGVVLIDVNTGDSIAVSEGYYYTDSTPHRTVCCNCGGEYGPCLPAPVCVKVFSDSSYAVSVLNGSSTSG